MSTTNLIECQRLLSAIQDALGTAEYGNNLVEVARNAHRAEQELASLKRDEVESNATNKALNIIDRDF